MRDPKEIGKVVRSLRGELSLREFAKKCDVSHTTIDNIEKGFDFRTGKPVQIKMATIEKIAYACGVNISYIIGDDIPTHATVPSNAYGVVVIRGRDGSEEVTELSDAQIETLKKLLNYLSDGYKDK